MIARVANKCTETSRTQQSLLHVAKPNVPNAQIELIRSCKEETWTGSGQEDCTGMLILWWFVCLFVFNLF